MIWLLYCKKKLTLVGKCLFTHHTCKIITATRLKKISLWGVLHAQQALMDNILFFNCWKDNTMRKGDRGRGTQNVKRPFQK